MAYAENRTRGFNRFQSAHHDGEILIYWNHAMENEEKMNGGKTKAVLFRIMPWALLAMAFLAFGIWVRFQMPVPIGTCRDTEIYSFDYLGYADTFCDFRFIGYGRFRHPLWGWLTSPVTLLGHRLYKLNEWTFWVFLLSVFSLIMTGCVALLFRMMRRTIGLTLREASVTTLLFLSFAHVWLLGGMPETYGPSMLLAVAVLAWGAGSKVRRASDSITVMGTPVRSPGIGLKLDNVGWCVLAILTGGITITQGAKTLLAFFVANRPNRRQLTLITLGGCAATALVVLVFYVRVRLRVAADASAPGLDAAWHTLVDNFAPLSLPLKERFRLMWIFFSEPVLLRGEPFDQRVICGGYSSLVHPLLLCILYGITAVSAFLNRRHVLVQMIGAMFLVDLLIHFACGWGLQESHLYAGHWLYAVPILTGLLFTRLDARRRWHYTCLLGLLAIAMLACNVHGYFGHDVGLEWPTSPE